MSCAKNNKSSAVAEMGDHFSVVDMGGSLQMQAALPAPVNPEPYLGAALPVSVGELGPHVTQCGLG